jgi:hypothetical protein
MKDGEPRMYVQTTFYVCILFDSTTILQEYTEYTDEAKIQYKDSHRKVKLH